jgi:hypothetical protein
VSVDGSGPDAGGAAPRTLAGALVALALLLAAACSPSAPEALPTTASATAAALATPPPMQPEDLVDLTIYLRSGEGASAHLEPVVREVEVTEDLPRRALELLLAGPTAAEASLEAPLPTRTEIRDLAVEGSTAHVDLSAAVLRDSSTVGSTPAEEALALAALANTLTEFPSIERVVVSVDGSREGPAAAFWGGWGLPQVLVRDESLVGAPASDGEGVVDLARFSLDAQQVGSSEAAPVRVNGVRVRDRITHTRFVIELVDAETGDAASKVPAVKVRRVNADVALLLSGVAAVGGGAAEVGEASPLEVDPDQFGGVRVEVDELAGTLRLVLSPTAERPFWLHTLTNPTRVVLDVKK